MRREEEAIISPEGIGSNSGVVGEREREVEGESSARNQQIGWGSAYEVVPTQKTRQKTLSPGSVLLFPVQRLYDHQFGLIT